MSPKATILSVIAGALAVVGLSVAYLIGRGGGGPTPSGSPTPPPRANLLAGEIRAVDSQDRPEASAAANEKTALILVLLNAYYNAAFVDTTKWQNGTHPELVNLFTNEAQTTVVANMGSLALAELAPRITSLTPTRQDATRISFLFESDLSTPSVIVTTLFEAEAKTKQAKVGPVKVVHRATFWLAQKVSIFRIMAYSAELTADTATRSAAFGSIPGAGP